MKEKGIVFKLTYDNHSVASSNYNSPSCLDYKIGSLVKPKIGKLFCFIDCYDLYKMYKHILVDYSNHYTIYTGIATDIEAITKASISTHCDEAFWEARKNKKTIKNAFNFDKDAGVYVCSTFLPISKTYLSDFCTVVTKYN